MVDLGKYTGTVLSAYAVTLVLIAVLVAVSVIRARRTRDALSELETKVGRKTHG